MKKEAPKNKKKVMLPEVMEKYGAVFSIDLESGFAHLKYEQSEMIVTWLNEDGYTEEEGHETPFKDVERVANFMREMKELRLDEYKK